MAWQPEQEALRQLSGCLKDSLSGHDKNAQKQAEIEGAMAALSKICEDNRKMLDKEYQGQRPLAFIIPKLIEFAANERPRIRTLALTSLNIFIPHKPQALLVSLDDLLNRLFQLASDPSNEVRRQVCRAFVQIVEIRPDKILPHIGGLVDYMIAQQRKTDDEELACDAAEFWLTVGEHDELYTALGPYLDKIIPVLLESMVYSEEDIAMLEGGGDDADIEDRAEDIKPKFAKNKAARMQANGANNGAANSDYAKLAGMDDDDLDEGEIGDDDDDDEAPEDRWNLRKCSAAALDVFANDFREPVFNTILPYLMTNLRHQEWPYREAAVLALGAVAEGCMAVVTPHLPDLVPYLISLLNDPEPLLRQITCWTLGRYSAWGAGLQDTNQGAQFFEPMMEGILTKMLDNNKRVQEAVSDQSRELFPLLECLSYVATALAESFAPFAAPVFTRCVTIIHQNLKESVAAVNNPGLDAPDKDFQVTSLDLLSAIIQAVDDKQSAALVSGSQPQLFQLLVYCMEDPENDVRQSSYALLGDCAKYQAIFLSTNITAFEIDIQTYKYRYEQRWLPDSFRKIQAYCNLGIEMFTIWRKSTSKHAGACLQNMYETFVFTKEINARKVTSYRMDGDD
ncbi:hypothetical protein SS1G_07008 [Sclerotinia sclerotiorum 1980 UF-70]|uniref:Importin N-terminal domain-containing protein n=1 Tax=Sclerotinia sclerotiorum (strain ATCC 18683 / 1980 / Ss-1) TaxID=665079 RepID=A7ENV9_SCLS1|nr:hypothetical protein SS1G_07008 [Sclerotinia sclerotiorum 1980 UF-70]EDO04525.1 hypothetical protein SS1G_07008 [Sclerotinia sclerotiorum 1980 UF-70]